ncbi:MAG: prolyl oligopeptidase family serine peptidase [bacterium]|nr:prolyl oligopeptidase family serine peptidase [bacterium]
MLKKAGCILVMVLMFATTVSAQSANFELAERFTTDNLEKMAGSTSIRPGWLENSDKFWYSYKTGNGTNFYIVDPARKTKDLLFDREYMASQLTSMTNKPYNSLDLDIEDIKFFDNNAAFSFTVDSLRFEFNLNTQVVTLVDTTEGEGDSRRRDWRNYAPDSSYVVYAKDHNLYLMKPNDADSVEIQLTTDGEKWYSYASSDDDTSKTKRLYTRATWFRDSKKLYIRRSDNRKVEDLWVINSTAKGRPKLETYKYPMPGDKNIAQEELIVFDVDSKDRVDMDVAKWKDQAIGGAYFNNGSIFTGEGSDKIYFMRRNRAWNKVDLCVSDTETGETKVLISEDSKPYFNTRYASLSVINDGEELLWWSERDGWGHYYLYDGEGNLKNRITSGPYTASETVKIDTTNRILYFEGYGKEEGVDPYYNMYYKVGFDGRGLKLLTPENATHSFDMSESRAYFTDTFSRIDMEPHSVLRDNEGRIVMELENTDISRLVEAGWKMPETFTVKAADGVTDLYGVMWKPFDFDPEKEYPIITYVYPGPQSEPVPKPFTLRGSRGRNVAIAQLGCIVVAVGNRGGSPQRSKYYHNWGYGNARDYPLDDNKYALEQLAARHSFIDIDRVGIYGHSGGGNMSTAAMFKYPDFYKAAVSSAGNHDNNIYNIWWGEIHYGVKEVVKKKDGKGKKSDDNGAAEEEGEKETVFEAKIDNNWSLAKNLKGHLLLVHGDMDNNVHPANTTRVVNALIKAGKRFDFMIMPGKRHGFGDYSKYFERMMWYYFAEHLVGDHRTNIEIYNHDK